MPIGYLVAELQIAQTVKYLILQWTRSERIRTVARLPLVIPIVESAERPLYQHIAAKALHLSQLGMSLSKIALALGVTNKTAAKAVRFLAPRGHIVNRIPLES